MLTLWHHPIYTEGLDPEARFPRERYRHVQTALAPDPSIIWEQPTPLDIEDILLAHDRSYRDDFLNSRLDQTTIRRIGLKPWTEAIVERTLILTNGTVSATRYVLEKGGPVRAGNLGGGTHHAYRDFGSGYCIFNDLAIAARVAQRDYEKVKKVLILDLDVHQGDGTASIFENDDTVRTVSFHCRENFPFRKMTSDLDVEFSQGTGDLEYLEILTKCLQKEPGIFLPDLILFQAGVDVLTTDRLGHLELSPAGVHRRNQIVFEFAEKLGVPLVITMGGGYGEPIKTSVKAHVDLFREAAVRI